MTRINIIPPKLLVGSHLIAEIKETNQLAGSFRKSYNSKKGIWMDDIHKEYNLNGGHVKFFYDKGRYLHKRFDWLKEEALNRGYNINAVFQNEWSKDKIGFHSHCYFYNDWSPKEKDYNIIVERIIQRMLNKPEYFLPEIKEDFGVETIEEYLIIVKRTLLHELNIIVDVTVESAWENENNKHHPRNLIENPKEVIIGNSVNFILIK